MDPPWAWRSSLPPGAANNSWPMLKALSRGGDLRVFPQIALAIGVLTSNRRGGWLPTLAEFTLGAIAGCHCSGAIAGC